MKNYLYILGIGASLLFNASCAEESNSNLYVVQSVQEQPINYKHTANWYDPASPYQGFYIEVVPSLNRVVVEWSTYSKREEGASKNRYYIASGVIDDDGEVDLEFYETSGGVFDAASAPIEFKVFDAHLSFESYSKGRLTSSTFDIPLSRLSPIDLTIGTNPAPLPNHDPSGSTATLQPGHTGLYSDPTTDKQGFAVDIMSDTGQIAVTWYTYDPDNPGQQKWFFAQGTYDAGTGSAFLQLYELDGGFFLDPFAATLNQWGTVSLEVNTCDSITLTYDDGDGLSRAVPLERLLPNVHCTNEIAAP